MRVISYHSVAMNVRFDPGRVDGIWNAWKSSRRHWQWRPLAIAIFGKKMDGIERAWRIENDIRK